MKNIKDIEIRDQELLKNPLSNIFAVNLVIHKKIEMKTKMIILLVITTVVDLIETTNYSYYNDRYRNTDRYRSNSRDFFTK